MSKPAGLVLLILGLILGPGYYVYTSFLTGTVILEQSLRFKADADQPLQADTRLSLQADMFPASVVLMFSASHGPVLVPGNMPTNRYRVIVSQDGELALEKSFVLQSAMVEAEPAIQFHEVIMLPSELGAGSYLLEIVQDGEADMEITSATMQVRANVAQLDTGLLAIGLGVLAAGLVIMVFFP